MEYRDRTGESGEIGEARGDGEKGRPGRSDKRVDAVNNGSASNLVTQSNPVDTVNMGNRGNQGKSEKAGKRYLLLSAGLALLIITAVFYLVSAGRIGGNDLEWHPFEWVSYRHGGELIEEAGIFLPVEITGMEEKHWLQLDTGSHNQLYEVPLNELDFPCQMQEEGGFLFVEFMGKVGGFEIDRRFRLRENYGNSVKNGTVKIGTLGSDFFDGRVLFLDYPRQRFSISRGIPGKLLDKIHFVRGRVSRQGIFLDIYLQALLNNEKLWLEFDTGTGLGDVLLSRENWREITGQELNSPKNREIKAANFGRELTLVGSPAPGDLQLGELRIQNPVVYTARELDMPLTVGNRPFADYLILLDLKSDRFGFVRSSDV